MQQAANGKVTRLLVSLTEQDAEFARFGGSCLDGGQPSFEAADDDLTRKRYMLAVDGPEALDESVGRLIALLAR